MKVPDFESLVDKYVCVVNDQGPGIDTWQVCVRQDRSHDLPDVVHCDNEEEAERLADTYKRSIKVGLYNGWYMAVESIKTHWGTLVREIDAELG